MTEQFANNASSTLNGAIDDSQTSIVVTNATSFPALGNFRLLLGVNPLTAEITLVTGVSGNTLTVVRGQEGTAASSWPDLTTVTHIVTAGAVEALRANLRRTKPLDVSLESVGVSQDGYALTWVNTDGYWAARPGSPFTVAGNEITTTGNLNAVKYTAGTTPLTTVGYGYVSDATQTFTVPEGVTSLQVKMWGPGGGTGNYSNSGGGGAGGFTTGFLSVTPGEQLVLAVGSGGKKPVSSSGNGGLGGWPGGGFGARGDASAGGGGGYTGIFNTSISQTNALIIAGGGGGASGFGNYGAGGGGGLTGGASASTGKGGTQVAGGLNGNNTSSPAYTVGGMFTGGTAFTDNTTSVGVDSGGGGSGYWGGGAGQSDGGAGGGGSGFIHATRVTSGVTTAGANAPAGTAAAQPPSTTDPNYIAGIGIGGAASGTTQIAGSGNNGGDGYIVFQWGGLTSLDLDSVNFGNGATVSTNEINVSVISPTNGTATLSAPGAAGNIILSPGNSIVTLQSISDFILSSATNLKLNVDSAQKLKLYTTGAVLVGSDAANNDTSAEAQAGLTGPLITLSSATGTFSTNTNQAIIFNQSGALNLQGNTEVRFNTSSTLKGYFDSNGILRIGPSAASGTILHGVSAPFIGSDYLYMYNSGGSAWAEIISGLTNTRAALQVLNNGAGGSSTNGIALFAAGTAHATVEYAGNGIIEQSGASTSGLIFTKILGNGTSFASTGAIWQSGAWTIGRATNNDTSSEAQAGLTGPLLNLTQTTGGSLTTVANQGLLYNTAGTITLQGNVGHSLIAGTTTVASTSTTKFITNVGRRVNTVVTTTNLSVSTGTEVVIVGAISTGVTITLPSGPTAGDTYTVKDQLGSAVANNIIISGNGNNIDGSSTYTMNTNYQSITVVFANGSWSII